MEASSDMLISYDATVVTGMEKLAMKECEAKIAVSSIHHSLGHLFIKSTDGYDKLGKLQSVDNIYVTIYKEENMSLADVDQTQLGTVFTQAIEASDWKTGIAVWKQACAFEKCDISKILDRLPNDDNVKPSFRVSCNRTGKQKFTSPEACCLFGGLINDIFHWPVSLKNFDLEILVTIKEKSLGVSLCLSKESLYQRHIVNYGVTSLRGTIAFNLIQVADIQPGDIVCDPLCGSGVIPIETAHNWPNAFVLAADSNAVAIEKTLANCTANNLTKSSILQWDATQMPFKNGSVDVFVTDLPFGKRLGSKHHNQTLYPALMAQIVRCARPSTGRIVLLTQDKSNANRCLSDAKVRKYCRHERSFFVKVGNLDSSIYLLKRNDRPFEDL